MKHIKKSTPILLIVTVLSFICCGCGAKNNKSISLTHFCFDTVITITIYEQSGEKEAKDIINECFSLCIHYEKLLSKTIYDSDISKINNSRGKPVRVNQVVPELISDSLKYSKLSDGAFDITVAPLVSLWNINGGNTNIPNQKKIANTQKRINYKNVIVDEETVQLKTDDTQIDLGGIAKGFVADKLKSFMISEGVTSAIIDLGGNILTIGQKNDGADFTIGIRKPFSKNNEYSATIDVSDKSVVTSGTYQRYFKKNNKIYHHILDTSTGYPVDNGLSSVTIISPSSQDGDALSTTVFVLGQKEGTRLINSLDNVEAVFITDENKIFLTDGLLMNTDNRISFKNTSQ